MNKKTLIRIISVFLSCLSMQNISFSFSQEREISPIHWEEPLYYWVQAIGASRYSMRAIVGKNKTCPKILINKKLEQMRIRMAQHKAFPINVCEIPIIVGADPIKIEIARQLLVLPNYIYRVAVIGESGAFLEGKKGDLNKVILDLEGSGADLIVHIGNYIETDDSDSQTSSLWKIWESKWFYPNRHLMGQTPFLFSKGNQESNFHSPQNWQGWNIFFSPFPVQPFYEEGAHSFYVNLPGFSAIALDATVNSTTPEGLLFSKQQEFLRDTKENYQFLLKKNNSWLITYRPVWSNNMLAISQASTRWREVLSPWISSYINTIISGGELSLSAIQMENYPTQYIIGNSNIIDNSLNDKDMPRVMDSVRVKRHYRVNRTGFALFQHTMDEPRFWKPEWHLTAEKNEK